MKCLSLRQPWAWAVVHAGKSVENRRWNTNFRGEFLIHAAVWPGDVVAMAARADGGGRRCKPLDDAHDEAMAMLDMARDVGATLPTSVSMRDLWGQRGGIPPGPLRRRRCGRMKLTVPEGEYEADTLFGLLWQVFRHRTWHLFQGHGWVD